MFTGHGFNPQTPRLLQLEDKRLGKLMSDLWFHRLEESPYSMNATRKQRTLYYMCLDDFQTARKQHVPSILIDHLEKYEIHILDFLSTRFLLTARNNKFGSLSLTIYDLFHGERR